MSYNNADGRVKIQAGRLKIGQVFGRNSEEGTQKRVTSLGKSWWTSGDEAMYGLAIGGCDPWDDGCYVQYAYYNTEPIGEAENVES